MRRADAQPSDRDYFTALSLAAISRRRSALASRVTRHAGRPKTTLLNPYFRLAGVDGMTDPLLLETLVASDVLPFERPVVVAHEWSHLAGVADEGEANYVGWLTCVRGSSREQYSGWLFLYGEMLARALPPRRPRVAVARAARRRTRALICAAIRGSPPASSSTCACRRRAACV